MSDLIQSEISSFVNGLAKRNPGEKEFHQAVEEVAESVVPFLLDNKKYREARILERLTEPDRIITFRVCWEDDKGNVRVNRGYRVQFNNAIGPYKGGLRFHPSVNSSILKFLGFEQIFKNSLTTLPLGAGKGGANFNPKGKSDREVMRFCQAFIVELFKHIGKDIDIPAGDIGVGAREIGYLYGYYKRLKDDYTGGAFTGKGLAFGGSLIRPEATGFGCVYFLEEALSHIGDSVRGKTAIVSGSGNVAQFAAKKLVELGAKVVSLSDSSGTIYDADGFNEEKLAYIADIKNVRRERIKQYAEKYNCDYYEGAKPWDISCDLALPCATQNEISEKDATNLIHNGCRAVAEGANMPTTPKALAVFKQSNIVFAPAKAANAGGVAVSGLEMTQNSMRLQWSPKEVDDKLKDIMRSIHNKCLEYSKDQNHVDYVNGANLAGFVKVADAMLAYGIT